MKLAKSLALALLTAWMPLAAMADGVTIDNSGGVFTSNSAQTNLTLSGSALSGVSGLGNGYDCGNGGATCAGSVALKTGALLTSMGAGTLLPGTGLTSFFGPGGSFDATELAKNTLQGFTFKGAFSSESWSCAVGATCKPNKAGTKWAGTWNFVGTIMNGMLTIAGQTIPIAQATTVNLTTTNQTLNYAKGQPLQFTNSGGYTNFPSPVPEPGTMSLFGGGLILIGVLARKRLGTRAS